jgi:hypothetical protein
MAAEISQRTQESYNSKDSSGKFKSIFIKDALGKVEFWKCSEDEHFINIIPYLAGKNNPNVKEGNWAYNLDIFVHRKVGVNEDSFICLSRSFGRKCPICDEQARLRSLDDYDDKFVKSLNPTRRVVYNIECIDSEKESRKGIQLFDVSHFLFEKELAEIAKKPRGGGFILFSHPDEGKTVFFRKSGNGPTNTEYKAFKFEDRTEPIPDEILDAALCLDELIHIPSYEEVYNSYFGVEVDAERPTTDSAATDGDLEDGGGHSEPAFTCPGTYGEDFGNHDACESCPDVAECEAAYEVLVNQQNEAEPPPPEPAAPAASTPTAAPAGPSPAQRRRAASPESAAPAPAAAVPPPAAEGAVRQRRARPGA